MQELYCVTYLPLLNLRCDALTVLQLFKTIPECLAVFNHLEVKIVHYNKSKVIHDFFVTGTPLKLVRLVLETAL